LRDAGTGDASCRAVRPRPDPDLDTVRAGIVEVADALWRCDVADDQFCVGELRPELLDGVETTGD
jgi:hypothetical protein